MAVRDPNTRIRVRKEFPGKTAAQQSFIAECDINTIMRKYEQNGIITHLNSRGGQYGNFIGFQDYQTSMNQIIEAQNAFDSLPSSLRKRFNNDAAAFLEFCQDEKNLDEMYELGLAVKAREEPVGDDVPIPDTSHPEPEEGAS